jgi:hypothetical protein
MIRHVWSVLCRNASIDVQTNNVCLLNTIEEFNIPFIPSKERPFIFVGELVSLWVRENEDIPNTGEMRVSFVVSGQPKIVPPITLDVDLSQTTFHRTRITITSIPILSYGRFEFQVEFRMTGENDWKQVACLPFILEKANQEENITEPC